MQHYCQEDKLAVLAKNCVKRGVNPDTPLYANFVRQIACGQLLISEKSAFGLTKILTQAYRADKWQSILEESEPEIEATDLVVKTWQPTYTPRTSEATTPTLNALKNLEAQTVEPIKTLTIQKSKCSDHLSEKEVAQVFYGLAQREKSSRDSVGRIILCEARDAADNKHLQVEDVLRIWRENYPLIDAVVKSNVVMVYFDGKPERDLASIYVPKFAPIFSAKTNPEGDVVDEEFDEALPEANDEGALTL